MASELAQILISIETLGPGERARLLALLSDATFDVDGGASRGATFIPSTTVDTMLTPEVDGRYSPVATIGSGGFGAVVATRDAHLQRVVARKELHDHHGASHQRRFLREARVTAQLEHPSIVPVYELGRTDDGRIYYTMKQVHGRTMKEALAGASAETRLGLLGAFVSVCQAIGYAHSRGVIHRDVKPENIILGAFGETVVLDWGIARVLGATSLADESAEGPDHAGGEDDGGGSSGAIRDSSQGGTMQGAVFGTPAYMSPEQARGAIDEVGACSDVWSLGTMLYEILTGRPPYVGGNALDLLRQAVEGVVAPVRSLAPAAPPELCAIAERACAADPKTRYPSASALATEVEAWRTGGRVGAYSYSSAELARRFVRRNRAAVAVAGVGVLAMLSLGALSWSRVVAERDRALASEAATAQAEASAKEELRGYLVTQARAALSERRVAEAAIYGARALELAEDPDARGAVIAAANAWAPTLVWRTNEECGAVAVADGARAVACATDHGLTMWAGSPLKQVGRWLTNHEVSHVAFEPGGLRVAIAVFDLACVLVLDAATGAEIHRWPVSQTFGAPPVAWDAHGLWVRGADWAFTKINPDSGARKHAGPFGDYEGDAIPRSPDGRLAATANGTGVHTWKVGPGGITPGPTLPRPVNAMAIAGAGDILATTGGGESFIRLLNTGDLSTRGALAGHAGGVPALAALRDDRQLLSVGADGAMALWDLAGESLTSRVRVDDGGLSVLAMSSDSGTAATDGSAGLTNAWQLSSSNIGAIPTFRAGLTGAEWSRDGRQIVACGRDGNVRLLDVSTGGFLAGTGPKGQPCDGVWIDAAGVVTALLNGPGLVHPFDPKAPPMMKAGFGWARRDPTGRWIASAGGWVSPAPDGGLRRRQETIVVDAVSGEERAHFDIPGTPTLAWTPDGQGLLALGPDGTANVWHVADSTIGPQFTLASGVETLAYSPDGATLAAGTRDGRVDLLSATDFVSATRLGPETDPVDVLAWSPDSQTLAAAGSRDSVALWNANNGSLIARLRGPHGHPTVLTFSPDGKILATGYDDGTLRFWDLHDLNVSGSAALAFWLHRLGLRWAASGLEADPDWVPTPTQP